MKLFKIKTEELVGNTIKTEYVIGENYNAIIDFFNKQTYQRLLSIKIKDEEVKLI